MSLDQQPDVTDRHHGPPRPGERRRVARIAFMLSVLVVAGILVVLSLDRDSGVILETPSAAPVSAAPVTPPSPPTLSEEEQILAQYRRFSIVLDTLTDLPASERPSVLREIATDPQYTSSLENLAAFDAAGETFYGTTQINPRVANIGLATAVVQDCQDGSQTGRVRKSDGVKLTVGLPAEVAVTQMRRGPDGIWRVAEVIYPPDRTC